MNKKLLKVPIKFLLFLSDERQFAELYVKLSDEKYVKLTCNDLTYTDTLKKYKAKGLEEIYMIEPAFRELYAMLIEKQQSLQFYNLETLAQGQALESLENTFDLTKNYLINLGISEDAIKGCQTINLKSLALIKQTANLYKFYEQFKINCSEEFLKSMLISHLSLLLIDQFPWRTAKIKDKMALAALLCDVTVDKDELHYLDDSYEVKDLPTSILRHPNEVTEILSKNERLVSLEVIMIIEQHHEKPDGTGYPHGLNYNRIGQLSSIYIVCRDFMSRLIKNNFNYNTRLDILDDLGKIYYQGNFAKSYEALLKVVT
jgi:response regulator RpfG family c-di-GMP phosphodiesterase